MSGNIPGHLGCLWSSRSFSFYVVFSGHLDQHLWSRENRVRELLRLTRLEPDVLTWPS